MPIFEYICEQCSKEFEAIVVGSVEDVKCPNCGSREIKIIPSTFSFAGSARISSSASSCSTCTPNPSKCSS
ncbi:MAG: FmdB family zinc ribbon protein, partial [Thermodesulfobacteriota bacterium]